MKLKIYNTLTRQKEEFVPIRLDPENEKDSKVGMYSCGPTVYSTPHIGNYKATFCADLIRNVLKNILGYNVTSVMNITDVGHLSGDNDGDADHGEDRLEKGAKREGITARDVAKKYESIFRECMSELDIDQFDVMPRATDHIQEQIDLVKVLEQKGYTYVIENDGIYIDTSKIDDYGKLMGPNYKKRIEGLREGARVAVIDRRNPSDFALRKFSPKGEKRDMERESPWGVGFPGWHIECSAMSDKYLCKDGIHQFDIHHGGPEHISIHHSDEIAQSECAFGDKPWVKYRIHHGLLTVDGGKMGKSLGNSYTLNDIKERGFSPLDLRCLFLSAHYRTQQDFTRETLTAAKKRRHGLIKKIKELVDKLGYATKIASIALNYQEIIGLIDNKIEIAQKSGNTQLEEDLNSFKDITASIIENGILNDLDTVQVLANLGGLLDSSESLDRFKLYFMKFLDKSLLKLGLFDFESDNKIADIVVPESIKDLAKQRLDAKNNKDYAKADEIRKEITFKGYNVKDTKDGYEIEKI